MPIKLNQENLKSIREGEMVRDNDVVGLIATRTKTGGLTFKVQHDLRGKTIRMTLRTKELKEARAEARAIKSQIAAGIDPRLPAPSAAPGPETWTVNEAIERYADKPNLREGTKAAILHHRLYLRPLLEVRLGDLTKSKCRDAHAKVHARAAADGAFRYLRAAYNYAAKFDDHGALRANPTSGVNWGKAVVRKFEPFDLAEWSTQVAQVAIPRRQFHLLCLLGGFRVGTLKQLEWDMIDRNGRAIHFTAAAMKSDRDFDAPLSDLMVDVIQSIPRLDARWVFPAESESGHLEEPDEWRYVNKMRRRQLVTGHQLRKMYRSTALALGIPDAHAGALLDHAQVGLDKNYASRKLLGDALLNHQEAISKELQRLGLSVPLDAPTAIG